SSPSSGLTPKRARPTLPHQLAPRAPVAAIAGVPKAGRAADAASVWHPELLPREGALREGRSDQHQHPGHAPARPRLPRSRVPPPQSPQAHPDAPSPSDRMTTGSATDFSEERD